MSPIPYRCSGRRLDEIKWYSSIFLLWSHSFNPMLIISFLFSKYLPSTALSSAFLGCRHTIFIFFPGPSKNSSAGHSWRQMPPYSYSSSVLIAQRGYNSHQIVLAQSLNLICIKEGEEWKTKFSNTSCHYVYCSLVSPLSPSIPPMTCSETGKIRKY